MNTEEQQFLNDLDKKLWTATKRLLPMLDAAVYKHVVLGLSSSGTSQTLSKSVALKQN